VSEPASSETHGPESRGLLELALRAVALKAVPRTGWLDRGVAPANVESVADHSFGVALLAWVCAIQRQTQGADLDPVRVLTLALVHDLAEAETGDVPPYDPGSLPPADDPQARRAFLDRRHVRDASRQSAKRAAEDSAMAALLAALPEATRTALADVWEDLRLGLSSEARFVKQVDRLETFLQSLRYLAEEPDLPMASFQREVMETIDDPVLIAIRDAALALTPPPASPRPAGEE
jgi:putative hydrolase of HD superfamily